MAGHNHVAAIGSDTRLVLSDFRVRMILGITMVVVASLLNFHASTEPDPACWDNVLAASPGAHPLQSWLWGEAKGQIGETVDRVMIWRGETPVVLAQAFERRIPPFGIKVAWIPRGPVICSEDVCGAAMKLLRRSLRARGYRFVVASPYEPLPCQLGMHISRSQRTFLLDLSPPLSIVEKNLDPGWRNKKNRFTRRGGEVVEATGDDAVGPLAKLYTELTKRKQFQAYGGGDLIHAVYAAFRHPGSTEIRGHIFQANINGSCAASILVLRVGRTAHYFWGAHDYDFRSMYPNEALHWAAIRRMHESHVTSYDLEGANPNQNTGVDQFKRRMGGRLVTLPPLECQILL